MSMNDNPRIFRAITFSVPMLLVLASFNVQAEISWSGLYSGAIYSDSQFESKPASGTSVTQSWGHAKLKLGKILNENFAVEGQLGLTTNSDGSHGNLTYGVYARGDYPFNQYRVYGLAGLGGYYSYSDIADNTRQNSFSYGAGIEIFGSKDLAITLEYLTLVNKSVNSADLTFDMIGIGFTYYFTEDTSYFNKNRNKIRSIRY